MREPSAAKELTAQTRINRQIELPLQWQAQKIALQF
jgi:hypothetical protein